MRFIFFVLIFFPFCCLKAEFLQLEVSAPSAILINPESGKVLYEKNCDAILYPASITKIATALYVLHRGYDLEMKMVAKREAIASISPQAKKQSEYRSPPYWIETDATHMGIQVGEEFYLKDLMAALLIASANDAANVIAETLGGTIPKFMDEVNLFLQDIGCQNTKFLNPHGLHHPEHQTTARDMALIAKKAMQYPFFQEIVSKASYSFPATNLSEERLLTQSNHLLRPGPHQYKDAVGIKTGYTSHAQKTLVAACNLLERKLIAVVLNCQTVEDRYRDVKIMFEGAKHEKKRRQFLLPQGVQKIRKKIPNAKTPLQTYLKTPLFYDFFPSEKEEIQVKFTYLDKKLPIEKDECVGKAMVITLQGKVLAEAPLFAQERLAPKLLYRFHHVLKDHVKLAVATLLLLGFLVVMIRKRRVKISM